MKTSYISGQPQLCLRSKKYEKEMKNTEQQLISALEKPLKPLNHYLFLPSSYSSSSSPNSHLQIIGITHGISACYVMR